MVNVRTSLIELTHTSYLPVSCCADHCDHVCVVEYPHNTPLTHGHWPRLQVNFYFHPRHSTSPEQKSCSLSCTASLSHVSPGVPFALLTVSKKERTCNVVYVTIYQVLTNYLSLDFPD